MQVLELGCELDMGPLEPWEFGKDILENGNVKPGTNGEAEV